MTNEQPLNIYKTNNLIMTETEIDIKHQDALEFLKSLDDKSVDLIVTDPPYKFENTKGGGGFGSKNRTYHGELNPISDGITTEVLDEMFRVMKVPNIYIWCNKALIPQYLNYFLDRKCNFDLLTWHKTNPVPTCHNKYLSDTEYCLYFRKGAKLYGTYETKRKYWVTPANVEDKKKYGHPTCKPLSIMSQLVENSTLEGQLVCDPYVGSGTTAVACKQLSRSFIGCDISEEYIHTAIERLLM